MISVEKIVQQHLPQLQQKPWLEKPVKGALKHLLHEQEFIAFAEQYPHLPGIEFIEQVFGLFLNSVIRVRDNKTGTRSRLSGRVVIIANHPIGSLEWPRTGETGARCQT